MGDIELDDFKVVNVTGKAFRDKQREPKKSSCSSPSLRAKINIIFICIDIIFVIAAIVAVTQMTENLEDLDKEALRKSIDRFTMLFWDDIGRLQPYTRHAAWQRVTAEAAMNTSNRTAINQFVERFLKTAIVFHENGTVEHVYRCGSEINYWGIIHPQSFATMWSEYHPGKDGGYCSLEATKPWEPAPIFPPEYFRGMILPNNDPLNGWLSIFPPARVADPMSLSIEAIMIPDENGNVTRNSTVYGYLVAAKTISPHLSYFASNIPGCISMVSLPSDNAYFDDLDQSMWNTTKAGSFSVNKTFTGVPNFTIRSKEDIKKCQIRQCPAIPLFNETDKLMTAYFRLCGLDPEKNKERNTCINYRMDRPMSRVEEGTYSVIMLAVLVVGLMVVLFIFFIIFLDCAVLRRVVKLSKTIREQTRDYKNDFRDDDSVSVSVKHTKKDSEDGEAATSRDEIKNLKLAVKQNTLRIRRRLEAVNDVLRTEKQKIARHKQAMQLMSLWCGRSEFFPGLRPNAALLRYEPTRSLDDLLSNPVSVEYLKSHCHNESTLANLFFVFDVNWLTELETAVEEEEDVIERQKISQVVSNTAVNIITRYIAVDAPQKINVSDACLKALRDMGKKYKRDMFKDAVAEIMQMLSNEVLPRFRNSPAYNAMAENLFIDSFASAEESDFSTAESISTTGSIISDDTGTATTSRMVAFNFKNLYATFDGDTDVVSTITNDFSVEEPASPALHNEEDNGDGDGKTLGEGPAAGVDGQGGIRLDTVPAVKEGSGQNDQSKKKPAEKKKKKKKGHPKKKPVEEQVQPSEIKPVEQGHPEKKQKGEDVGSSGSADSESSDLLSSSSSST